MQFYYLKKLKAEFLHFFFPHICILCKKEGWKLCPSCLSLFQHSAIIQNNGTKVFTCFEYTNEVAVIMKNIKYRQKCELAEVMANFIYNFYKDEFVKGYVLVPISINFFKRLKRNYSVPHLICLHLAKKTKLPFRPFLLNRRLTGVKSQVGLLRKERLQNLQNSFYCKPVKHKNIILVDDIITTGTTMKEAAKTLKAHGAVNFKFCAFAIKNLH